MDKKVREQLERFARVMDDEATWVYPWRRYWRMVGGNGQRWSNHIDLLVKIFNKRFEGYTFYRGETVEMPRVRPSIIIDRK